MTVDVKFDTLRSGSINLTSWINTIYVMQFLHYWEI